MSTETNPELERYYESLIDIFQLEGWKYLLEDLPLHVYRCLMSAEAATPDGFPRVKELAQWGPLQSLAPTWHGRVTPQRLKSTCPAVQCSFAQKAFTDHGSKNHGQSNLITVYIPELLVSRTRP